MKIRHKVPWLFCTMAAVLSSWGAASAARAADASDDCTTENVVAGRLPTEVHETHGNAALITDGAGTAEGAVWNAPAAVRLGARGASITYDLGRPRSIAAFVLEADANDAYQIAGSLDGTPGSFRIVATAANMVDRGPGLRVRSMQIAPVTVRYLRIGEADGDGSYSIAEFAAYCRTPMPFPPAMRMVDAPMDAVPIPADEPTATALAKPPQSPVNGLQVVIAIAIALLAGTSLLTRTKVAAPTSNVTEHESRAEVYFPLVLLLFVGSGCAALMYEIIWFQLLQLVLGSSAVSIGVLLGVFMGGMCIGSLALARFVPANRHPLRVYAFLELAIGASGLLMLVAMPIVEGVYTTVVGHGLPGLLLRGFFASICLLPPTMMMGATLPAVARWVKTTPRGVSWLGYFYAGNTAGAVIGCLLAGFYLLRVHDMTIGTFVAVALNVVVAAAAVALARKEPHPAPSDGDPASKPPNAGAPTGAWVVYLAIGLSGMSALGAEVIWTRLFSLLLSGNTYTFSIILAVFLIGIGLGSGIGSFIARRTPDPRRALAFAQVLLILAIAWGAWSIARVLPNWPVNPSLAASPWFEFQIDFVRALWAILPAACLWGASFPFALAAVATEDQDGGRVVGRIYAANTVGAIVGALGTSLVLIAWVGTQNGQRILITLAAISAIALVLPFYKGRSPITRIGLRDAITILVIVELGSVMARNVPAVPPRLIGRGRMVAVDRKFAETYIYVGEGMNSSPAVSRTQNGILSYHNAGKIQASSMPQDMRLQRMLGHLTTLLPEQPRNVLVIACGAGVTAGAASIDPRVERLTIAEIEPLVPEVVARYFGDYNYDVVKNPKVHIEIDDARHFLNTTREKFDAITSDPFDPWVKGAAALYTKEFWELAKQHLTPGGVVTVFVQLYESGMLAVKSEVATFFEVFPNGVIWSNTIEGEGYDVVLSGQADSTQIDVDRMNRLLASPDFAVIAKSLRQIGFESATDLLSTYGGRAADLHAWLADAQINRDNNLRLQFLAGLGMNVDQKAETHRGMLAHRRYPDDLFAGSPEHLTALRVSLLRRK